MQPYVIRQGDYLAKLAHKFSFDADAVWNDPKNQALQKLRPNPSILLSGDVLYIPEPAPGPVAGTSLTTGTTNTFVSDCPTVPVSICFLDASLASQPYTLNELPQLTGLTTAADGTATFDVPVTLGAVTLVFTASGATYKCQTGNLDPINTLSGIFQRLQHLGYLSPSLDPTGIDPDWIRAGLLALKAAQADDAPPSSAASSALPSSAHSGPSPITSPPASTPADAGGGPTSVGDPQSAGSSASPASAPPSSGALSSLASTPPSSASPPSSGADSAPSSGEPTSDLPDDSGLNDDGTLDDATCALLLQAHGS